MKTADEAYEEWCGVDRHTNDCHPVHDSTETIEFAEAYAKEKVLEWHKVIGDFLALINNQVENNEVFGDFNPNKQS